MIATVAFPITIDGVYDYLIPDHPYKQIFK